MCLVTDDVLKEADLYSAFIEVPCTQGAQVRITQCYLQTTPYLPLPRKHSPDGEVHVLKTLAVGLISWAEMVRSSLFVLKVPLNSN